MKVIIFWTGVTSKGINTIGVKYFKNGFACKAFIEVEDLAPFGVGEEIDVPKEALN